MGYQNDLFLRAALGETVERPPVWLMRQAGRILPQYRALRANFPDFKAFVKTPVAAATATIQPVDELNVDDIATLFPDLDINDILQIVTSGGTKAVTPITTTTPKITAPTPGAKTTQQTLANLGLNAPMPSQDPYANIKLMEELFGGDTAYKLRSLGAPNNLASADIDALARMLRG